MSTHSEDSDSGLLDSGYEILTDSTIMTDDDDDGASSVASIDDDDNLDDDSISCMADSTDSLSSRRSDPEHHDPHPIPSFGGLDEHHLDGSGTTLRGRDSSPEEIYFDEPMEAPEGRVSSVVHRLLTFSGIESAEMCRHLRLDDVHPPVLYSTVRQTMTKELLEADEPFRVLYVGSTAAKDEIQHKLAAALATAISESTSSSGSWDGVKSPRYNIIPISSFGSRSTSPEVELVDSSGLDMTFDMCTAAKASKHEGQPDTLSLWLNGNQNITSLYGDNGVQLESLGWKLPHLTVVYCSDDDNVQRRMTRVYARGFMARHAVPTLVISQNPLYQRQTESYALDVRSVHICIESESEAGNIVHKQLPIDLSTFLNLNPRQLNRNLGYLTGLASGDDAAVSAALGWTNAESNNPLPRDVEKEPRGTKSFSNFCWIQKIKRDELWKLILVGWIFVCGLAGATFGIAYMRFSNPSEASIRVIPAIATFSTPSFTLQPTTSLRSTATTPPLVSVISVSSIPSTVDFKSQLLESKMMTLNASDQFQVHTAGSNHVIIRPPKKYLSLRRQPTLFVRVTRNKETINAELSKLFDGVYTLCVDEDEAWGVLTVSIWTKNKPIVKETVEVDFGTSWMKVSRWVKVVEERRTELQTLIDQAATDAKEMASDLSQTAGNQAAEIRTVVLNKAKEYSESVSNGLSKLYQDTMALSQKLIPMKDGKYVRKAQKQAKSIWSRKKGECVGRNKSKRIKRRSKA